MDQVIFRVKRNVSIAPSVFLMKLKGDTAEIRRPGQFVNIKIEDQFLRRPLSVCEVKDDDLYLVYRVVGAGTEKLSKKREGDRLDILTGLGNGFDTSLSGASPVLIGGGTGVSALFYLARTLVQEKKNVTALMGFNTLQDVILMKEFNELGVRTVVTTVDGSYGQKGMVTDVLDKVNYSFFYACGPEPMLKAVCGSTVTSGQLSFEQRMGCGFGACMGCSCKTISGSKRICKDGPVLKKEELLWED